MSSGLVSVIVPVYNVQDYLNKCANSILAQTYKNLELLLIDDGSSDKSPSICDALAFEDSRVRVIHQENNGVSAARNIGIGAAIGEYICFVDSDDFIAQDYVERLLQTIEGKQADIAVCSLMRVDPSGKELYSETVCPVVLENEAGLKQMLLSDNVTEIAVWNKIYKRSLFIDNKIIFPSGKIFSEDVAVIFNLYAFASRIAYTADILYFYVQRSSSVTNKGFTKDGFDSLEIADEILDTIEAERPELREAAYKFRLRFTFTVASEICRSDHVEWWALQILSQWSRKNIRLLLGNKYISIDKKMRVLILAVSWRAYFGTSKLLRLRTGGL